MEMIRKIGMLGIDFMKSVARGETILMSDEEIAKMWFKKGHSKILGCPNF